MLVLSRRVGEKIFIGDDIVLTLVSVRGSEKARIGIDAPGHIQIEREEVLRARESQVPKVSNSP